MVTRLKKFAFSRSREIVGKWQFFLNETDPTISTFRQDDACDCHSRWNTLHLII